MSRDILMGDMSATWTRIPFCWQPQKAAGHNESGPGKCRVRLNAVERT
jgi:hypothetical protein